MHFKNLKKSIAIALTLITTGVCFYTPVSALEKKISNQSVKVQTSTEQSNINKDISSLATKYNLKVSDLDESKLPEGVQPIVVNNFEELDQAMSRVDIAAKNITSSEKENIANLSSPEHSRRGKRSASSTQMAKFSRGLGLTIGKFSTARFNVYSSLNVYNKKITSVNYSNQSLTGYTLGLGLEKGGTSCTISRDKRSATVRGTGTISGYILYQGIGKLYSKDYTVSGVYRAR